MNLKHFLLSSCLLITTAVSHAEIILNGTRVVYPSNSKEVSLQLNNNGSKPALVQSWIDDGDPKSLPNQVKVPFIITPPISRIEVNKGQTLRISALPNSNQLSQTQETLFWLNVLDVPPRPNDGADVPENYLQFAIRSRIKLFYRPSHLKGDSATASTQLKWAKQANTLVITNPSPFYVSMTTILQKDDIKTVDLLPKGLMIAPFSKETVQLKLHNTSDMSFMTINDYGGRNQYPISFN